MSIDRVATGASEAEDRRSRYDRQTEIFQGLLDVGGNPIRRDTDPLPCADIQRWSGKSVQTVTFDSLRQMSDGERSDATYGQVRIGAMRRIVDGVYQQCVKCFDHIPMAQLEITPFRDRCEECLKGL